MRHKNFINFINKKSIIRLNYPKNKNISLNSFKEMSIILEFILFNCMKYNYIFIFYFFKYDKYPIIAALSVAYFFSGT